MTKTLTQFQSGWCATGNHARCVGGHDANPTNTWVACRCTCHQEDTLEPTPEHSGAEGAPDVPASVSEPTNSASESLVTPTGVLVTDAAPETDEWFAARREGITGTDLPKILGYSKYGNALSVWRFKRGEDDDEAGEAARWGQILEEPVALEWAERNDTLIAPIGVVANVEYPWMRASLDRVVLPGTCPDADPHSKAVCGLEVKTRSAFKAADWRDGIPDDVLAQTAWGLMVTGLDHMHVAALIGGQRLVSFRVDRDPVLEDYLLDAAAPVWAAVTGGVPPDAHPDSDGILLDLLDRMYQSRAGDVELDPGDAGEWLAVYADGSEFEKKGKALKTQAKTALVQMLGDGDTGLIDGVPAFTYTPDDPRTGMPADEVRRLKADKPALFDALTADDYLQTNTPRPTFRVKKKPATQKETDQ